MQRQHTGNWPGKTVNGRWPTVILLATIFIAADVPAGLASLAATGAVVAVTLLGRIVALLVSAFPADIQTRLSCNRY